MGVGARIAAAFAAEALACAVLGGVLLDRRLHQQETAFGVNQWGYRDEARGSKEPGELRVAIVGGSAAFEAGIGLSRTFATQLFFELRDARPDVPVSVVNLAEPRAGADSYAGTLKDYDFLDPEVVCVFDGYDALEGLPPHARRRSAVFRATGYLPLLPARLLGTPGWLSDADGGIAALLADASGPDVSCRAASAAYCDAMAGVVRAARQRGLDVVVMRPPSVSRRHAAQQESLGAALTSEFGLEPHVTRVDLGGVIDLSNRAYSPDRIHRTEAGNHELAWRVAAAIWRMPAGTKASRSGSIANR